MKYRIGGVLESVKKSSYSNVTSIKYTVKLKKTECNSAAMSLIYILIILQICDERENTKADSVQVRIQGAVSDFHPIDTRW